MGIDFLKRTAPTFERSCQRGYDDLKRVRLFDSTVSVEERTFLARLKENPPSQTDPIVLRMDGDEIAVFCNERRIGTGENPPTVIVEKLKCADQGLAIAQISHIHEISGTADISIA